MPWLRALDAVFVFTFLAEWLVRVYLDRKKFLKDFANWFATRRTDLNILEGHSRVQLSTTGLSQSAVCFSVWAKRA